MGCCECLFEWKYIDKFYKILGLISLGLSIIDLILTFCVVDKKANKDLLVLYLFIYVYLGSRTFISVQNILIPLYFYGFDFINIVIIGIANFILIITCISFLSKDKEVGELFIFLIITLANFLIDVMFIIPYIVFIKGGNAYIKGNNSENDVFEEYLWKRESIDANKTQNEIYKLDVINYYIKAENKKIINSGNLLDKLNPENIKDRKIDAILSYTKKYCNKSFSLNDLFQYFLEEIKENCGLNIDQNKFREMSLVYIQKQLTECLTCPLTKKIFVDPLIAPNGETFETDDVLDKMNSSGNIGNNLNIDELIQNKLVAKISKIIRTNKDFNLDTLIEIRKLLINPDTKTFYSNPYVIWEGEKLGDTAEKENGEINYENKIIKNIMEQIGELLSDEFLEDIK